MTLIATPPAQTGPTGHPLVDLLVTREAYPHLRTVTELDTHVNAPGVHCVFLPGEVARNLETPDVAVVLPELRMSFQGAFDCAVAQDAAEKEVKERIAIHKTPSLVFFRDGRFLSALPRVRDWSDYMTRIPQILAMPTPAPDA